MAVKIEHPHLQGALHSDRVYSPDILPRLQALLAHLADIDFAYEKSLEIIRHSPDDEVLKSRMVERLRERHQEQRAQYVRELSLLEERIAAVFA